MTGYEPHDVRQRAAQSPGGMGDPVTGLSTAEADRRPEASGTQQMSETAAVQAGQAAQMAREKAARMQERATGLASRARDAATSDQVKPMAWRSGTILVVGGAVAAIVIWRRRSRRNETSMQRFARTARAKANMTRGQAQAGRKAAKSASAVATAKAAKSARTKAGSKGKR